MCFSATASFTAGAFLLGTGVMTTCLAKTPGERVYAAIPLLFAIQQLTEGLVWLSFAWGVPWVTAWSTQVYSFFSHVLWPVYVPVAALLVETEVSRRRVLLLVCAAGLGVGAWLLYSMFAFPIKAVPVGGHIEYASPHFFAALSIGLYLLATTVSLIVSSHPWLRLFGALALVSWMLAYAFYARWFISVWCFFAAVLSVLIVMHFLERRRTVTSDAPARP
jgi:hypothetical protein